MVDLNKFRQNATQNGICGEYSTLWDSCLSKKEMADLGLSAKGLDYLCNAIAKGWGISPELLSKTFKNYINGKYRLEKGYTSALYCLYNEDIVCETTALGLVNCNVSVIVPEYHICKIYATANTNITLSGKGEVIVIAYGDPNSVIVNVKSVELKYKRIQKTSND